MADKEQFENSEQTEIEENEQNERNEQNENTGSAESEQEPLLKRTRKKKHGKLWVKILIIAAIVLGIFALILVKQNGNLEKCFYQVKSNDVLSNIRIVCISDMHLKEFGSHNKDLVDKIKGLEPDMITIVGDMNMENRPNDYEPVIELCAQLNIVAPLYYSLGNHEIDAMLFKDSQIYNELKEIGIKVLNNETETINIEGTDIDVIGLTQNPKEFDQYGRKFFENAMKENPDNFKLVLTHYPENFEGILEDYDIDLALAGHAHGGQVRLPWIGGLYAADQGMFPKLCDGYHEIGNSKLIITRGLGKSGIMPRINNRPEITVVDVSWY